MAGMTVGQMLLVGGATAATAYSVSKAGKGMPAPPTPTVMPTTNDEQVKAAKRRQIAEMQARSGRASTMLSDPGARLGG